MALSLSSFTNIACTKPYNPIFEFNPLNSRNRGSNVVLVTRCESEEETSSSSKKSKLVIGSPIIITEAPITMKTAASVPCLRVNSGLVKPGDVGRIVSRKPKDVWAVRLSIGTYLIDGKYFQPLELDE